MKPLLAALLLRGDRTRDEAKLQAILDKMADEKPAKPLKHWKHAAPWDCLQPIRK
jgi:hypothetical protein